MGRVQTYLTAFLLAASVGVAQAPSSAGKEQIAFLSADSFPESAALPEAVLKLLLRDRLVRDSIETASDEDKRNPAQLFRALEVHLFSPKESDLFIVGNTPIAGADNGWFWVVRSPCKNPRVVLFATGYALELLGSRTNGYHDIRGTWSNPNGTETRIYRFDGTRYKLSKKRWDERR